MARLRKLKIFLILLAVLVAAWNYFLRESLTLPFLSGLTSLAVYLIAAGIVLLAVLLSFATRRRYNYNYRY